LIDLERWLDGSYSVSRHMDLDDLETLPPQHPRGGAT